MDNSPGDELTCAMGCAGRIYVGAADGTLSRLSNKDNYHHKSSHAYTTNVPSKSDRSGSVELSLAHALWRSSVCAHAITSLGSMETSSLLLVGSAGGELVVLRKELVELRRFQLESAVQHICADQNGDFIVGDMLGNLYGVSQYEILWKRRLPFVSSTHDVGPEFFYPSLAEPTVKAITLAKLLDVEKTLSNYVLVATGQKQLLVTNCGQNLSTISTHTPIATLTSFPGDDEDVVLAAGEEGVIYRLVSYCDTELKEMPTFRFAIKKWTQVPFSVVKLLSVKVLESKAKQSKFAWICLGVDGEVALFCGQELVKVWSLASFSKSHTLESDFPVDMTLLDDGDANFKQQNGVIVYPQRIHIFPIELMDQH